jgi:hypothetical protein
MRYIVRSVDGAEYGPFTSTELRQLVHEQRLGPGDFIRREEGRTWSPFEKIAGLGDVVAKTDAPPDAATEGEVADDARSSPSAKSGPVRPRPTPTPETLETSASRTIEIDLDSILPAIDPSASRPVTPPTTTAASIGTALDSQPRSSVPVDPARSNNPFVAAGLPLEPMAGEDVEFVLVQSFLDASRESLLGAVLGHRGRLICTNRRTAAIMPGFGRSSMTLVWLDRIESAAVRSRTSLGRMIFGVLCLLYAAYALVGSLAVGAAMTAIAGSGSSIGGVAALLGMVVGGFAALLGLALVLTARGRAVIIGDAASGITFACSAASPWHLAKIDEGRRDARTQVSPGGTSPTA